MRRASDQELRDLVRDLAEAAARGDREAEVFLKRTFLPFVIETLLEYERAEPNSATRH